MSGIDKIITDTNKRALIIAALIVFVAWYFCLIIIPAFPNSTCPAGIGLPGAVGGSSGGSSGGNVCPECPNICPRDEPDPQPSAPYCSNGVPCPPGNLDTYYGTCRCVKGTMWDTGMQLCCPVQVL